MGAVTTRRRGRGPRAHAQEGVTQRVTHRTRAPGRAAVRAGRKASFCDVPEEAAPHARIHPLIFSPSSAPSRSPRASYR
ncbi:hypothetical protein PVAP13_8NG101501 [Panicum virgatum]|uniref:Uncharacterized protein n=1 Tax=Panicum virgatum TaxID=38727 RepID=A0A8T0PAD4_PANVG|nr:hypothetical protein PVAP13_8NG101501 [Panicum virgatum]